VNPPRAARLLAGCMSGTSADGIDTALLRFEGDYPDLSWELLAWRTDPLDEGLKREILRASDPRSALLVPTARLHTRLGEVYAEALRTLIRSAGLDADALTAVGLHGQTVFHDPRGGYGRASGDDPPEAGTTVQIGSAAVVAERLGCDVVGDFRSRDVAAGGEGAPLVPFADAILFRDTGKDRVMLNLGGIANLTWLPAGRGVEGVTGFDTGPGVMVMDALVRAGDSRLPFDLDGGLARTGKVIPDLLEEWLAHPFLRRSPPKSTGREDFGEEFAHRVMESGYGRHSLSDLVRTAVEFTVESIVGACGEHLPPDGEGSGDREIIVAGGGTRHPVMMECLTERFNPHLIRTSDELGLPVDAREAAAFALLADAFLQGVPANLPAVTGAIHPVVLGGLVPGPRRPLTTGTGEGGTA